MNRFENKVVVITGAAGGIGEATTRRIVSEGGKVVIADHSEKRAEQLANELTHAGADVRHVYFSATELQSCKELIDFSMNEYQRIDVLINNVGGTDPKRDLSIEKLDINYFDEAFHLNLCCTMYLSQQVIPIMTANGGGNIVNVASISGLTADANGTLYGASKAGVINLTKYIATQIGKKNIRCNAVAPGLVLTPAALDNLNEDVRNIFLGQCATPYLGEPEDVAATIAFLASNDARYITGQTIVVVILYVNLRYWLSKKSVLNFVGTVKAWMRKALMYRPEKSWLKSILNISVLPKSSSYWVILPRPVRYLAGILPRLLSLNW